jgi:DNA-binding NarL/FixJ family response regulator
MSSQVEAANDNGLTKTVSKFTGRQMDVARLFARGCTPQEIAAALKLGEKTIQTHFCELLRRSGARNRYDLLVWCRENKLHEEQ